MSASREISKAQLALARLREPSTMAGLGVIATLTGRSFPEIQAWMDVSAAVLAVLAVMFPERKE